MPLPPLVQGRKPDPATAMRALIEQARALLARARDPSALCDGDCTACVAKQVGAFDAMLDDWEDRLARGEQPDLGALHRLGRDALAVRARLAHHGLLAEADLQSSSPVSSFAFRPI